MKNKKMLLILCMSLIIIFPSVYSATCCVNPYAPPNLICVDNVTQNLCCPINNPDYYSSGGPTDQTDCENNYFEDASSCDNIPMCTSMGCCCPDIDIVPEAACSCTNCFESITSSSQTCSDVCININECSNGQDDDDNGCADWSQDTGCETPTDTSEDGGVCTIEPPETGCCCPEGVQESASECNTIFRTGTCPGACCGDGQCSTSLAETCNTCETDCGGCGQSSDCDSPSYSPSISLSAATIKGEKQVQLSWQDNCNAMYYEIFRCQGAACNTGGDAIVTTTSKEHLDQDAEWDKTYTYRVTGAYSQSLPSSATKTVAMGNLECWKHYDSNTFCINSDYYSRPPFTAADDDETKYSKAFNCDGSNILDSEGSDCTEYGGICYIDDSGTPSCKKTECKGANVDGIDNKNFENPFAMYYTKSFCEDGKYCFYDKSFTIKEMCYNCNANMACYDYKSQEACQSDNCDIGDCIWNYISGLSNFGVGVCVDNTEDNCIWCGKQGSGAVKSIDTYNLIFDQCTEERADKLSSSYGKCYFNEEDGTAISCADMTCNKYPVDECPTQIATHDQDNVIQKTSDFCNIGVCMKFGGDFGECYKNGDGDSEVDCTAGDEACEADYFPPSSTLIPVLSARGTYSKIILEVRDKVSAVDTETPVFGSGYKTYLCIYNNTPCGPNGHPYGESSYSSNDLVISNLKMFEQGNPSMNWTLSEGINHIRYYSQDPSKNIEAVKEIIIYAFSNVSGPIISNLNVSGATFKSQKFYTNNKKPEITVEFYENAIMTFSKIFNNAGYSVFPPYSTQPARIFEFDTPSDLSDGNYSFDLNAKSEKGLLMDKGEQQVKLPAMIIVDTQKPIINITPKNGNISLKSEVEIKFKSSEEVMLTSVTIAGEDVTANFTAGYAKDFTKKFKLTDGWKELIITAKDVAGNVVSNTTNFKVDAYPVNISLLEPRYGVSPNYTFNIVVGLDDDAECRYYFGDLPPTLPNYFNNWLAFDSHAGLKYIKIDFNRIMFGDTNTYKFRVACKDTQHGLDSAIFDLSVDITPPIISRAEASPNPADSGQGYTELLVNTDDKAICKYSMTATNYLAMAGLFNGYDQNKFSKINNALIENLTEGNYTYYVACENMAALISSTSSITLTVQDLPLQVEDYTPDYVNTTSATLAVYTNKDAFCKYSQTPGVYNNWLGTSNRTREHKQTINVNEGTTVFYAQCELFSEQEDITITIIRDTKKPTMLFVNDSSELTLYPEFTCNSDRLKVKWLGEDNGSGIYNYQYLLLKSDNNVTVNWTETDWYSSPTTEWNWINNLNLTDRAKYLFKVKSIDRVFLQSNNMSSNGVTINTSKCTSCNASRDGCCSAVEDGICDSDCSEEATGPSDKDCPDCTSSQGDCCDDSVLDVICDLDCPIDMDPNCKICSDGRINQDTEDCDGTAFGKISDCTNYSNFIGGTLQCSSDCRLDTLACEKAPYCGDNVLDPGETCDGNTYGSISKCTDISGFASGAISCSRTCQIDTSKCVEGSKCGNKAIDPGESCDGTNFGQLLDGTCYNYDPSSFNEGNLSCVSCQLDTSKCLGIPGGTCGDSIINEGQDCDGNKFGIINECKDLNFTGGILVCSNTCQLDTSKCTEQPKCGNGAINTGENCDSSNFGKLSGSCANFSAFFESGNLQCIGCKIDTSSCEKGPSCGNNYIDANLGETCDGANFGSLSGTCSQYYSNTSISGRLTCSGCEIGTSSCELPPGICGDGNLNKGEDCDKTRFGAISECEDIEGYTGGNLSCNSSCKLDVKKCRANTCGNGAVDPGEECDEDNFGAIKNKSCSSYQYHFLSGTLSCDDFCQINTFNCKSNCSKSADNCCSGKSDGVCDPDCTINSDRDCKNCTSSSGDCCYPAKDAKCDSDCPTGTDTDCSASSCQSKGICGLGEPCTDGSDCVSKYCDKVCKKPGCDDKITNGDESDNDCGGSCSKCANGKACSKSSDCESNYCDLKLCKVPDSCKNNIADGTETDIDCGGICPGCEEGESCINKNDCASSLDCINHECSASASEAGGEDTDGDGMPDEWEAKYEDLDPMVDDSGDDIDGDGFTNIEEYEARTNPTDPDSHPQIKTESSIWATLFLIIGILLMIAGIVYLFYTGYSEIYVYLAAIAGLFLVLILFFLDYRKTSIVVLYALVLAEAYIVYMQYEKASKRSHTFMGKPPIGMHQGITPKIPARPMQPFKTTPQIGPRPVIGKPNVPQDILKDRREEKYKERSRAFDTFDQKIAKVQEVYTDKEKQKTESAKQPAKSEKSKDDVFNKLMDLGKIAEKTRKKKPKEKPRKEKRKKK